MERDDRDQLDREAERLHERGIDAASARASDYWQREFLDNQSMYWRGAPEAQFLPSPENERISFDREGERLRRPTFDSPALLERREFLSMLSVASDFLELSWDSSALAHRVELFEQLEEAISYLQGRSSAAIELFPHERCRGYFRAEPPTIGINLALVEREDPYKAVGTYFHEARHAYQRHVIHFPDEHPEVSTGVVASWREVHKT